MSAAKLALKQWQINDRVVFDIPTRLTNSSSPTPYVPAKPAPLRQGSDDHLRCKSRGNSV